MKLIWPFWNVSAHISSKLTVQPTHEVRKRISNVFAENVMFIFISCKAIFKLFIVNENADEFFT